MDPMEELAEWVKTCSPLVQKNVTLIPPKPLYHISVNGKIPKFVPQLSRRTAKVEDRSVSRISVAPTIAGCLSGYMADLYDFEQGSGGTKEYKGGWYVYQFLDHPSLLPTPKILFDVEKTDEHWLVPYRPDLWKYPAEVMAKFFYTSATWSWIGKTQVIDVTGVFEVFKGHTLQVDPGHVLPEGYYDFTYTRGTLGTMRDITPITASEYAAAKKLTADLLSYKEPPSAQW